MSLKKDFAEAETEFQTAIRLDPTLFAARYFFGRTCQSQGKLLEAAQHFEQAGHLRPDDYQPAAHLGTIYHGLGRTADAQAACQRSIVVVTKHLELHPDDARALYLGATVWSKLEAPAQALEWASRALAMDPEEPVTLYNVACVYALLGQHEGALDCLENALKFGFAHKQWIEHDSDLDSLHGHPRYQALLTAL
ncbi:MAG: tetratricopeptide repeat protein [Planctomycetes bacterium]|nr:tetratricopeptide repeat protein [Planctomycetota bacterium]